MSDYFGQSPDGYQKPLYAASNFSDVVDKPTALVNLGAASADDVLKAANPIGTIIAFYGSVAPYGYLPCSGQTVSSSTFPSLVTFLGGTTSATLPDLRGEFLRGWDNGRGVDTGRAIRTWQVDLFASHNHAPGSGQAGFMANTFPTATGRATVSSGTGALESYLGVPNQLSTTASTGGTETRPRNISVLYCIKAYDTPVSAGILNVATLASEMALKTALTDFTGTNQIKSATGYQKLPGGVIIQWGSITSASASGSVIFPIAFPTAVSSRVASLWDKTGGSLAQTPYITAGSTSLNGMSVNLGTFDSGAWTVGWIVIGY